MGIPVAAVLFCDRRVRIGGRVAGKRLAVRGEVDRVAPEAVEVNIEAPERVVHVSLIRNAGQVNSGSAYPAQNDTVITEGPFDYIVVVGGVERSPQD